MGRIRPKLVSAGFEAEMAGHAHHAGVFAQDLAIDFAKAPPCGVSEDGAHETVAEALALHVRAHENGIFSLFVLRVRDDAHDAVDRAHAIGRARIGGDEGHFAVIVDLGETRGRLVGKHLHRAHEAQAQILGRAARDHFGERHLVLRADGPKQEVAIVF